MIRIFKSLIRISSFLGKEMTEIFRQPRLILTLVLGPFLIMFLFGLGYPDQNRTLRTTFVATDPAAFQKEMTIFTKSFNSKIFDYVIENDKERAMAKLALNQTDLVIVVPDVPFETIKNNQQAEFLIYHNEVDPIQIGYIQSVARILVAEVNRQVLQSAAKQGQADSGSLQTDLETAIAKTQALRKDVPAGDVKTATQAAGLEKDLTSLHEKLTTVRSLAPGILVSPFSAKISGLSEVQLTVTGFFAPAVIVLLLQHVSITFASLSIVRERRSGIMELFRVAPIKAFETLAGKYLSYLFFEIILAGVITVLAVWLLRIPILGRLQDYALAVVVLLFTSLGVGFLISLISQTDTQAVQYSMLLMLASIFFSGFFLDLRLMKAPITVLAWSLPATYGIRMLQDVMLRGSSVPLLLFLGIAGIGIGLFLINWMLLRKTMES
ncbi:MAG TPA: ABC transporter permease [Anaerolineales bacterium]|nr:ABC transporter permease [Anaerolineales bacterium]